MTLDDIEGLVLTELRAAEKKHPGWPTDMVHAAAILVEEAGELIKEALDHSFGVDGAKERAVKEAAQTAAMGFQFLLGMDKYE